MTVQSVQNTLPFFTALCGYVLLSSIAWASPSNNTSARAVPPDAKQWMVEISRSSVPYLQTINTDRFLKATLERIRTGFEQQSEANINSAGYYWYVASEKEMCNIYPLIGADLDYNQPLATIEGNLVDRTSCKQNAKALKKAVERSSLASYIEKRNRRDDARTVSAAEAKLVDTILSWAELSTVEEDPRGWLDNIKASSSLNILSDGYVVKRGETLSSIAEKVTGNPTDWTNMRVLHQSSGLYALDPNRIYPNDRVYFTPAISSYYISSSLPGYLYSTEKTLPIADVVSDQIGLEFNYDTLTEVGDALIAVNQHLVQRTGEVVEVPMGVDVWIPQVVVGWQEVALDESDPLSIAERVYGNDRYEFLVATICPTHHVERVKSCVLPTFDIPQVSTGYWGLLKEIGMDLEKKFLD